MVWTLWPESVKVNGEEGLLAPVTRYIKLILVIKVQFVLTRPFTDFNLGQM